MNDYVHGYSLTESCRLGDQAQTLSDLLHRDTLYPAGAKVLEAGCGVGAQTLILARNNPRTHIVAIDTSARSLSDARRATAAANLDRVTFQRADIYHLPFKESAFDHLFVCFVLEHLPRPLEALSRLMRVLRPGGTLTAIEGDHGSYFCHPKSSAADRAVQCLIDIQSRKGGNGLIGRRLYPLLRESGLEDVHVSPRMVYVDADRPDLVEGFTKNTFTAMVQGVREEALELGLIDAETWDRGIADLLRTTREDGTFCYTFFKGIGKKTL